MNSSYPQPVEVQLDQLLLFQKHNWAGVNSWLCSKSRLGRTNQSGIRERASSEDTICNTLAWWVGVLWLGNSCYLCWEGQQFLLKLPGYFMTMQQKHACSMSLKNWRYANHLKVIWSHSLPNNFRTFEACCSSAGTAGALYRQQGVKAVAALERHMAWWHLPGVPSQGFGACSAILAQRHCHHSPQWPGAPAAAPLITQDTVSLPGSTALLCSAFHACPGHRAQNAPFPNESWGTGAPATQSWDLF